MSKIRFQPDRGFYNQRPAYYEQFRGTQICLAHDAPIRLVVASQFNIIVQQAGYIEDLDARRRAAVSAACQELADRQRQPVVLVIEGEQRREFTPSFP